MTLTRLKEVRSDIHIGEREFARVFPGRGSFAQALGEGRVFACDYTFLQGAATGNTLGSEQVAARAVRHVRRGRRRAHAARDPARPEDGSRVVTPGEGTLWEVAKLAVQIGDANHHETVTHLGRTHMVMEAVSLALKRQLAERHPLHRLLWAHCEYTLPINNSAATNLIAPGGAIDTTFGGTIQQSVAFVKQGIESFDLGRSGVPTDIAARGLDDTSVIADHPYRDDALPVFGAIKRFVDAYVRLAYASDEDVTKDLELAAFVRELGSQDGGRIPGVTQPTSIDTLALLVTNIVWIASGQHAAVNFTQYPFMGYVPNMAGAFWSEWPPTSFDEANLYALLLPPYNVAVLQMHTVYQLSQVRVNHLGHYGLTTFLDDPKIRAAISTFQEELKWIETDTKARDAKRTLHYDHLLPSKIPLSIHI